jgi:hypothetical protein
MYSTYFNLFILDKKYILKKWYPNLDKPYLTLSVSSHDLYIKLMIISKLISFFFIVSSSLFLNKTNNKTNYNTTQSLVFGIKYCEFMLFISWLSSFFNGSNTRHTLYIILSTLMLNEVYTYLVYYYIHHIILYLNMPYSIWLYYLTYSNIHVYLYN